VLQRGHNKRPCFHHERDYRLYVALLGESARMYPCAVHAYALMTNHVHLLMTPDEPDHVSRLMKRVNEQYSMHFNRIYARIGSVWAGRFKACLIDSNAYLLRCHRYIELNPVRAGMVAHAADYPWSSYRANAYGEPSDVLTPHDLFRGMGEMESERRLAYRRFIMSAPSGAELEAIRAATTSCTALGDEEFVARLPSSCQRRRHPPGRPKKSKLVACDSAMRETGYVPVLSRHAVPPRQLHRIFAQQAIVGQRRDGREVAVGDVFGALETADVVGDRAQAEIHGYAIPR
jgi:putative transposase